ncbi:hypothetical protein DNQ11_16285 [Bacillus anthracis]|nr:hypothetical protein DNQ11_16285 [Bacillus anthracis]
MNVYSISLFLLKSVFMTKSITKTKVDLLFYKEIGSFVYVLRYKSFLIFSAMSFSTESFVEDNQKTYIVI